MGLHKHSFTLIEILVVIAIIGILASILFPVLLGVGEQGRKTETQTLVNGVRQAVMQYKSEYFSLPNPRGDSGDSKIGGFDANNHRKIGDTNYYTFFDILTYSNHSDKDGDPSSAAQKQNPKGISFLTPTKSYFDKNNETNGIRDSWHQPLEVHMDYSGDGKVDLGTNYGSFSGTHKAECVVLSMGPQKGKGLNKGIYISSSK